MTNDDTRAKLLSALVARYARLRTRLTRKLGSDDLATESLHEVWIKLHRSNAKDDIPDYETYLYRAAINTAINLHRTERRALGDADISAILEQADQTNDPERIVHARSELAAVGRVLRTLTARQRDIFLNAHSRDLSFQALAEKYDVTLRMVQLEFKVALKAVVQIRGS